MRPIANQKMQKQYYNFMIWQIIIEMNPAVHSEELREKILDALDSSLSQCIQNLSLQHGRVLQCFRRHFIIQYKNLDRVVSSNRFGTSCPKTWDIPKLGTGCPSLVYIKLRGDTLYYMIPSSH